MTPRPPTKQADTKHLAAHLHDIDPADVAEVATGETFCVFLDWFCALLAARITNFPVLHAKPAGEAVQVTQKARKPPSAPVAPRSGGPLLRTEVTPMWKGKVAAK